MSLRASSGSAAIDTLWRLVRRVIEARADRQRGNTGLEIRLLGHDGGPASSDEAAAILTQLRRTGRMPLDTLVRAAAETIYRSELARDGATLDLGLLAPRHFVPAIRAAIEAGRGRLWEVQSPEPQRAAAARDASAD